MEELLKAIADVYAADSDLVTAIPGGLWREKAKRTSVKPYGRYFVVSAVPSVTAGETEFERVIIQFDVFDDDPDASIIWDCYAKLTAAFPNPYRLAKTASVYVFWRVFEQARWEEGEMYHLIVQYRVEIKPN